MGKMRANIISKVTNWPGEPAGSASLWRLWVEGKEVSFSLCQVGGA